MPSMNGLENCLVLEKRYSEDKRMGLRKVFGIGDTVKIVNHAELQDKLAVVNQMTMQNNELAVLVELSGEEGKYVMLKRDQCEGIK